jgi:hypothetical protein
LSKTPCSYLFPLQLLSQALLSIPAGIKFIQEPDKFELVTKEVRLHLLDCGSPVCSRTLIAEVADLPGNCTLIGCKPLSPLRHILCTLGVAISGGFLRLADSHCGCTELAYGCTKIAQQVD